MKKQPWQHNAAYLASYYRWIDVIESADVPKKHMQEFASFLAENDNKAVVESPFAPTGETKAQIEESLARNITYARKCMHYSLTVYGEIPLASHTKYTQPNVLDDTKPHERVVGMAAGFAENAFAKRGVLYVDLGVSEGMVDGVRNSVMGGRAIVLRSHPEYRAKNDPNGTRVLKKVYNQIKKALTPEQMTLVHIDETPEQILARVK